MPVRKYEEIVIGSSLSAVIFAFNNELPIFFTKSRHPKVIDRVDPNLDLSFLGIENERMTLNSFGEKRDVGTQKSLIWDRLLFILALDGRAPLANICETMRYNGETLVFNDEYKKIGEIDFEKCYYYGDDNAKNLVRVKKEPRHYICHDWVRYRVGGKHDCDYIETNDDFVNKILYYYPYRQRGNSSIKTACAISKLKTEQIHDFDYSGTMTCFKVVHEMKSRGMKARVSEYGPDGKPKKYKAYKTEHMKREMEALDAVLEPLNNKVVVVEQELKVSDLNTTGRLVNLMRKLV